jgi:hypothetical protein
MKHLQTKLKNKAKQKRLRQFLNRDVNMGVSVWRRSAL